MNSATGAVVGAAVNTVGSGLGGWLTARQQYNNQKKLMRQQRVWDREDAERDWRWQNEWRDNDREYYSYANDKQRLIDAGLSPYLNYGEGGAGATATSSSAPSMSGPGSAGPTAPMPQNPWQSFDPMLLAKIRMMDAQANDLNAAAEEKRGRTNDPENYRSQQSELLEQLKLSNAGRKITNAISEIDAHVARATEGNRIETSNLSVSKLERECNNLLGDFQLKVDKHSLNQEEVKLIANKVAYTAILTEAARRGIELTEGEIELLQAKLITEFTQQDVNKAKSAATTAQGRYFESSAKYLSGKPAREWFGSAAQLVGSLAGAAAKAL